MAHRCDICDELAALRRALDECQARLSVLIDTKPTNSDEWRMEDKRCRPVVEQARAALADVRLAQRAEETDRE